MSAAPSFDLTQVFTLQSDEAIARWNEIEPLLKRIELVDLPLSAVRKMVANKEAQAWCIGNPLECVLLTKIENTTERRYGLLWMAAGDLRLVEVANKIVEPWFKSMGCTFIQIVGRRGWKKHMPEYEETSINMVKYL